MTRHVGPTGRIAMRLYDHDDRFIGADSAYIRQYVFRVYVGDTPEPRSVKIRYSIQPR